MTGPASKPDRAGEGRNFRAYYALAALVVGLIAGMLADRLGPVERDGALGVASFVGTLWLNALKMTVIPLVVSLLITGVASAAVLTASARSRCHIRWSCFSHLRSSHGSS